ncbi:MAG: 4Fe-4S binding protein [Thermodesulfobacteriota bacterium]|nr:4Fe-4S binding protein [Thermodesulfobacteriota bacterium]
MAKGEITIDEKLCKGCGLCVEYCPRGCISMPMGKLSEKGLPLVVFSEPEKCNACCVCGWMCPDFAIEVYKLDETKAA